MIGVRILIGYLTVSVQVIGPGVWLSCIGNTYFWDLGGHVIGFVFRLTQTGSQEQIIGVPTGWWVKTLGEGYIEGAIEGNFKNHSMWKSICTRLFRKGKYWMLICSQSLKEHHNDFLKYF